MSKLSPGNIVSAFAVIQRTGYIQNGDTIREVTITGVNFSQYKSLYSTTFVAASGTISPNPSNNEVVIGTRVNDPRQNGTIFTSVGDEDKIVWTNATTLPPVNETYSAQVSAVLQKIGGFGIGGPSDQGVYIPISQAESFFGTRQADMIIVQLKNSDNATVSNASYDIKNAFSDQVSVISGTAVIDLLQSIFGIVNLFLGGIAAISLLVAGIGIMNIMIVSLIERTREIGILKALGMKSRTVLSIFLGESMIIGLIGAVIGIALGWGLANIVAIIFSGGGPFQGVGGNQAATSAQGAGMTITPVLTPEVLILALAFGIGVSVIFALYPAWRASRLKPVDALRYE